MVKKQYCSIRICVDYHELNANMTSGRYMLPLISDQINKLQGANYFTSLDTASDFQFPLIQNL